MRLNLDDWQGNREIVSNTIGELIQAYPNDIRMLTILDGFYSMQLHVDRLVLMLNQIKEESRLSKEAKEHSTKLITDIQTFRGRIE